MSSASTLSKKRYEEFGKGLLEILDDQEKVESALKLLRDIMKFDPEACTYTPEQAKKIKAYREKKKEEGISVYVSSGCKASYEKKKMLKAI